MCTLEVFEKNGVFEDVLGAFVPEAPLQVRYGAHAVDGAAAAPVLTPAQTRAAPTTLACRGVAADAQYTLLMVDPDPPSRQNPVYRAWLHWAVTDVRVRADGTLDVAGGHEAIAYAGPTPPKGTGLHRYCFILFRQVHPLDNVYESTFVLVELFCCFHVLFSCSCVLCFPFLKKHYQQPSKVPYRAFCTEAFTDSCCWMHVPESALIFHAFHFFFPFLPFHQKQRPFSFRFSFFPFFFISSD